MIDEELAKRAKEAYSFSEYIAGSATKEWQEYINRAEQYLKENNIENKEEILEKYKKKTSDWMNKMYFINASVPSVMITGGSNFPVKKKEQQNERSKKHYEKYDYIFDIKNYIKTRRKEIKQDIEQKEYKLNEDIQVIQNTDLNRLQLKFEGKPKDEIREILKKNGYKWSSKNQTWQRQLTQNALININKIKEEIGGKSG